MPSKPDSKLVHDIVERARTIHERLTQVRGGSIDVPRADTFAGAEGLQAWQEALSSRGNPELFARRLHWDDLELSDAAAVYAELPSPDLPSWARALLEILRELGSSPAAGSLADQAPADEAPVPFEHVLGPLVSIARARLCRQLGAELDPRVAASAIRDLERRLLLDLSEMSARSLWVLFINDAPLGLTILSAMVPGAADAQTEYYDRFVQQQLDDRFHTLLTKFPVVGRMWATRICQWVETTAEFLVRLGNDWADLQAFATDQAAATQPFQSLVSIATGLSDAHNGGRQVSILTFDNGFRVVYKPRDLGVSVAYHAFLRWCEAQGLGLGLKALSILEGAGYGWVQHVPHAPCDSDREFSVFYERAGGLLCVLYLLGATDCHFENVIASGEDPHVVDGETLLSPRHDIRDDYEDASLGNNVAERRFRESVIRTNVIPQWRFAPELGSVADISALGSASESAADVQVLLWTAINSDGMRPLYGSAPQSRLQNVPFSSAGPADFIQFLDELRSGFRTTYRFLMARRAELLSTQSPLREFQGKRVRFVYRPTHVYQGQIRAGFDPALQRDGREWSLNHEQLVQAFLTAPDKPRDWAVFRDEIRELEQLDVPYFYCAANGTSLCSRTQQIENFFVETAFDGLLERLKTLSPEDLEFQDQLIRASYAARRVQAFGPVEESASEGHLDPQASPLDPALALEEAERIANDLARTCIRDENGTPHWLDFSYSPSFGTVELNLTGPSLYAGCCGIALFLASLDAVKQTDDYGDLWRSALLPIEGKVGEYSRDDWAEKLGIGGGNGLGGILYALSRIADLRPMEHARMRHLAGQVMNLDVRGLVRSKQETDIIAGAAGFLLGALSAFDAFGDSRYLELAQFCGESIVAKQERDGGGWNQVGCHVPATGFSHGAAGISHALMRLHELGGDESLREAAERGVAYEASVFDRASGNWPVLRDSFSIADADHFRVSWCHGAPGIGSSRLAALESHDHAAGRADLEAAIETTRAHPVTALDQVCCGNLGRLSFLFTAARHQGDIALERAVLTRARWLVERARQQGRYGLFHGEELQVDNPGFFQGNAGIAYTLLRFTHPELLPDVLVFGC
ncbi:type 2 lanthipeptide synthetase LanM family protein [Enhygromyxa salina]|uniref:Lanthionine synthetase C-like protein n=1 Tax=Enhygromyxa salina TaxID=215803 RepID=A0A2S9XN75_9BACT|nr:type 2 lanthipeptide synthetase LanM family protein [Enhygromyxa salina]PRP94326.1 Lanthionine synthetase C-like protein [Enhygromyxa salina]